MTKHSKPRHVQSINLHEVQTLQYIRVRAGLTLRPLDKVDAPRILEILDADTSIRESVSVASKLHTLEDIEAEVESYLKDINLIRYAILENDNPIGLVSLWRDIGNTFDAPDNPDDYGFGYFIDPSKRGKGIVTDSVRHIMGIAAKNFTVNQFIAYCEDSNASSLAVLTKLGFQPTDIVLIEQNNGWSERKYICSPK